MTDLVVVDVRIMWEYETLLAEKVAFVGKKMKYVNILRFEVVFEDWTMIKHNIWFNIKLGILFLVTYYLTDLIWFCNK